MKKKMTRCAFFQYKADECIKTAKKFPVGSDMFNFWKNASEGYERRLEKMTLDLLEDVIEVEVGD